jgi:hypothetical protein
MAGRERLPREPAGQMRESGGSSTGHNRETTGRANDYPVTEGCSPAPPPLTDHTQGRSPAPPPLTDHTQGRSPAPPPLTDHTQGRSPAPMHPPEGASKARQIEPVSLPGQAPPAAG